MADRKPLSARTRFEVFKRDRFQCQYCGRTPPTVTLQVDHIVPVAGGGPDEVENLLTSCAECNGGKGAVPLDAVPPSTAEQAAELAERRAQLKAFNDMLLAEREATEESLARLDAAWVVLMGGDASHVYPRVGSRRTSLRTFLRNLPEARIREAMDIAAERLHNRGVTIYWQYFCGVCWKTIRESQGTAEQRQEGQ